MSGVEALNQFGTVLIDNTWANYALIDVRTINSVTSANLTPGANFIGSIYTGADDSDLIFVYCQSSFSIVGVSYVNSVMRLGVATRRTVGVPVTFYRFKRQNPMSSTYGLQVFDQSSNLLFDANADFAKIVGSLPASSLYNGGSVSFSPNKKYAVCIPSFSGTWRTDYTTNPGGGFNYWQNFYSSAPLLNLNNSTILSSGLEQYLFFQVPALSQGAGSFYSASWVSAIIADVTGI